MAYKIWLYPERWDTLKDLSFEDKGKILECIFEYERIRSIPFDWNIKIIFWFLKNRIDADRKEYEAKCIKNKEISVEYWKNKTKPNGIQTVSKGNQSTSNSNSNSNSNIYNNIIKEQKVFFQNIEVNKIFIDYLEMRKNKWTKFKPTERAIELLIKKLNTYKDEVKIQMLEKSIINWRTDVYPTDQYNSKQIPPWLKEWLSNKSKMISNISKDVLSLDDVT